MPKKGWLVVMAGLGLNLALGILYAWSMFSKQLTESIANGGFGWSQTTATLPYTIAIACFALIMIPAGRLQDRLGPKIIATAGDRLRSGASRHDLAPDRRVRHSVRNRHRVGICGRDAGGRQMVRTGEKRPHHRDRRRRFRPGSGLHRPLVQSPSRISRDFRGVPHPRNRVSRRRRDLRPVSDESEAGVCPAGGQAPEITKSQNAASRRRHLAGNGPDAQILVPIPPVRLRGDGRTHDHRPCRENRLLPVGRGHPGGIPLRRPDGDFQRRRPGARVFLLQASIMFFFDQFTTTAGFLFGAALVGFNYGSCLSLFPATAADYWGTKNLGLNYGILFTAWGVGGVFGPNLAGMIADATGSYATAYQVAGGLLVFAALLGIWSHMHLSFKLADNQLVVTIGKRQKADQPGLESETTETRAT
jgi:hypothetical protein